MDLSLNNVCLPPSCPKMVSRHNHNKQIPQVTITKNQIFPPSSLVSFLSLNNASKHSPDHGWAITIILFNQLRGWFISIIIIIILIRLSFLYEVRWL